MNFRIRFPQERREGHIIERIKTGYWGLNSGLCTCQAGLPLELYLQPKTIIS
jgi:hypothetical protein